MVEQDRWSRWLLESRFGGDAAYVGAGDGLIGFGALDRVGPTGRVIFSDVSRALLDHCRAVAADMAVSDRCEFVEPSADDLGPMPMARSTP